MNQRIFLVILMATSHCGFGAEANSRGTNSKAEPTIAGALPASKSPTVDGESDADHVTRHCFVLCGTEEPRDLSRAGEFVAEVFGDGYSADVTESERITVRKGKDDVGFLMYLPTPIPQQEAEQNADQNVFWPKGKEEAARHRSQVIVTNIGAEDQTPVQSAITVSRLALVALKVFDGIGVYWGNGSVCNSREVFEGFCENMAEKHVPVPMWIRLQLIRTSDGELGLHTRGMDQFSLMEIEVDRCMMEARDLIEFVSNFAHYLIQSEPSSAQAKNQRPGSHAAAEHDEASTRT